MTQASLGESVVQKVVHAATNNGVAASVTQTQPLWLLAEVTYRCPLHCAFCYNPTDYDKHTQNELTTEQWIQALRDARKLGAIQLGISGGEPLLRDDIEDIVIEAKKLGYYSNLITSGVGLTENVFRLLKMVVWIISNYLCTILLKKLTTSLLIPKLLSLRKKLPL